MKPRAVSSLTGVVALAAVLAVLSLSAVAWGQVTPPPGGTTPPRGGTTPPPGGPTRPPTGETKPPTGGAIPREECDASGKCRQVVDLCDPTGNCRAVPLEECREREDCRGLLADQPGGEDAGGPGRPGDAGAGGGTGVDGGLPSPVREECDDRGNCREVVEVCDERGECRVVPLEECEQDESCRAILTAGQPGPGDLVGSGGTGAPDDFVPPVREECDESGNCRQVVEVCDERGECRQVPLEECQNDEDCSALLAGPTGGGPAGPTGSQPPVREECDDRGNCRQVVEVCDERGKCRDVPLEECEQDERCRAILTGGQTGPGGGAAPAPQGALGELLEELQARLESDPRARLRVKDLLEDLDDERDREFLERLAGLDGQLSLEELGRALGGGPLGPGAEPPRLGLFEGVLDGIDLAQRLLLINGQGYTPADDIVMADNQGRPVDVTALLALAGNHPKVAVELNESDEVVRLLIISRVERIGGGAAPATAAQEFFGQVGLIESAKIVLSGPRFRATARTRFVDEDNKPVDPAGLGVGTLVSVTPGPPDLASGAPDPTAVRVQVVDPRRPPSARADVITGHLLRFDPVVELDGPRAQLTAQTRFSGADGGPRTAADVQPGLFVRIVARAPGFGEEVPVAEEVTVLAGDFAGGPPPPTGEQEEARPTEEIRVEGFVQTVGSDYLVLQGQRLQLDTRVLVSGLGGARIQVGDLLQGDLLEIDTRPGGQRGFVVTRIQVIDPSVQTFVRPGVIVGAFEGVEQGELVLSGPYFQVPSDAEIKGQGGRAAGLADLVAGNYVRLSASPPRFERGETLPVAFKIRVSNPPDDGRSPVAGTPPDGGRPPGEGQPPADSRPAGGQPAAPTTRVVSSFPEDGDVEVPTQTAVEVRFTSNVTGLLFDPEFKFTLFPQPLDFGGLKISADGRTISAEVELEDDRSYQLVVLSQKTGLFTIRFTTGAAISTSSIAGQIALPEELPRHARFVPGESFAVLLKQRPAATADFSSFQDQVVSGTPLTGREFEFASVEPGTYFLTAFLGFDLGRGEFIQLQAVYDENADGQADPILVNPNQEVEVELRLSLPEALAVVSLSPAPGTAGVAQQTQLVIQFNRPAILDGDDIHIFPPPVSVGELEASPDGTTFTLALGLAEDTIYRVVVEKAEDVEGGVLAEAVSTAFTTGAGFASAQTVRGRLVLPDLPAARIFHGPILVGLVRLDDIDPTRFGIDSFDEEDIVGSTISFTPEFTIDNAPSGRLAAVAFVRVDVPRGFRPPDPGQRPLADFDLVGKRFNQQVLEVFDTLELFGFAQVPVPPPGQVQGPGQVTVLLRGSARTREELLRVAAAQVVSRSLAAGAQRIFSFALPDRNTSPDQAQVFIAVQAEGELDPDLDLLEPNGQSVAVTDDREYAVRVEFSKPLRVERGIAAIEVWLDGRIVRNFRLSEDGRRVYVPVQPVEDRFYRVSVLKAEAVDGSRLQRPLDLGFGTGAADISFASVSGTVTLETLDEDGEALTGDAADQIDEASVFLFQEEAGQLALVGATDVEADGTFILGDVLPGVYQVFAELLTASGQEIKAIFDADDDGLADLVSIAAGAGDLTGIAIQATVVVATEEDTATGVTVKTTPSGGNEGASLSLVFACDDGIQCPSILSNVEVGQEVDLDLYVSGAVNLDGFAAKLRYDADILDFVSATDQVEGRTNFLRLNDGLALFLSPLLREPELEYGGGILGSTEATAPDGEGFLGRFRFQVTEEFEGAQVFLEQVKLNSTVGQDVLSPALSAKLAPQVFEEQTKGVVSFDFNTAAGDQEEFHKGFITAGDLVEVDVYLNLDKVSADFADLVNYSVTVEFDPDQVTFLNYAPETAEEENLLLAGGGQVPPLPAIVGTSSVTFGAAILGPTAETAPDSSGLVGRLTLATTDSLTETDLLVTAYAVKSVSAPQLEVSAMIVGRMSTGEITRVAAGDVVVGGGGAAGDASGADFDGSGGIVDYGDFFLFADAFGKEATGAFAAMDLDGSGGIVDYSDFFLFADFFGKPVGKVVPTAPLPAVAGGLDLAARSTAAGLVLEVRAAEPSLRGYATVVEYDPALFRLREVSDATSALRADGRQALLLTRQGTGQVVLAGSGTAGAPGVKGLLAELHFTPLRPEAEGLFRLSQAVVRDEAGRLGQAQRLAQVEARWVPRVFALEANYPNPFNPSTTIAYQLPVDSRVRLQVYDVLGQRVRTLVDDERPAGFHRLVWSGRDDAGRAVGAGVYIYRMEAGDFRQVRKLLLLK